MKKIVFLVLAMAMLAVLNGCGKTNSGYQLSGASGAKSSVFLQQEKNNGFFIAGNVAASAGCNDFYTLEVDAHGKKESGRTIQVGRCAETMDAQRTSDGGSVFAGNIQVQPGGREAYILKIGSDNSTQWEKTFGGASDDEARSVRETADKGYIVAGFTQSFGKSINAYMIKTDSAGKKIWEKVYGGNNCSTLRAVVQTEDGGFLACGTIAGSCSAGNGLYVLRTDALGKEKWSKAYGANYRSLEGCCLLRLSSGGYIIAGNSRSKDKGDWDMYLAKIDETGNLLWEKSFGTSSDEYASAITESSDGGFILAGLTYDGTQSKILMAKNAGDGTPVNSLLYGGGALDMATCVEKANGGGYLFSGRISASGGKQELFIVKTDEGLHNIRRIF